ncbi:MAG: hypothetical protein LBR26_13850 [Prevotella sp.]|jgi:hypothetical protein|nr:hypothetical protein [Prevotella sp.]
MDILLNSFVFTLLGNALGSIFPGVFLAVFSVGLLFFIIKGFYPKSAFTPAGFIVCFVLFLLLSFQFVLMCGAFKLKSMTDDIKADINCSILSSRELLNRNITPADGREIIDGLLEKYPMLAYYTDPIEFGGNTVQNIAETVAENIHGFLNGFIWRRVGWSLAFIAASIFIVIRTLGVNLSVNHSTGAEKRHSSAHRGRRNNDF